MRKISLLSLTFLCFQGAFSQTTQKFNNEVKEFNDWYVSAFVGANALQNSDLVSWGYGYGFNPGYDFQLQVTKEVTHAFGISLMGQLGKTRQFGEGAQVNLNNQWEGRTNYLGISLLG